MDNRILSSETVTLQTFREYGMRFDIEENFLDDKSNGFELERSMIRCAPALSHLCLVLAIATVYLTLQGTAVVAQGKRRWVDPHWERGNSYLRIGWNWVKTALARGWPLFETFCLIGNFDPAPPIASRKQHYWQRTRNSHLLQQLDKTHHYLTSHCQSRLIWEVTLSRAGVENW